VWHGAEEVGLLGSNYHVQHPVVPLEKIVAVINGDMIGRNHPDTAALLGSQPPNRNAPALVDMALAANARVSRFAVDSSWDRPGHPENFFRRSDHWPYARRDVPVVYFSALLHGDYHTPRDDPESIDYGKLTRMAKWMYATGWAAATTR
jgi:Zn-dependent M28 family amino/carboxypeptidase